jgi:hypothetical protein
VTRDHDGLRAAIRDQAAAEPEPTDERVREVAAVYTSIRLRRATDTARQAANGQPAEEAP